MRKTVREGKKVRSKGEKEVVYKEDGIEGKRKKKR